MVDFLNFPPHRGLPPAYLARVPDGEAVERPHGHVDDLLAAQTFDHRRLPHVLY